MKKGYLIIILSLLISFVKANDLIDKAEKAYDSKKYSEAIKNYESLIKEGYQSFQLYYNLGNSYYRNNEIGKAIYNYELAKKLEPSDEDVRINLSKAAARTLDKIDSKENFFINVVKTNVLTSFTTRQWAWFSIYSLILICIAIFVFVSTNKISIKRFSFVFAIFLSFTFLFTYVFGYSALVTKNNNKFAIILTKESKIYNEPTLTATSKFVLHEGTKIRLIEGNGDWALIKLDNGNEGWVKKFEIGVI